MKTIASVLSLLLILCTIFSMACVQSSVNHVPKANAGSDQKASVGDTVLLDGSKSSDEDGDRVTFRWSILSCPSGSTATLSSTAIAGPTFVVDTAGTYVTQLIVTDGLDDSSPDTVTVTTEDLTQTSPSSSPASSASMIIDHRYANIRKIPEQWIQKVKGDLHVAYWHSSHGSQLTIGMEKLDAFMGGTGLYTYNNGGSSGALDLVEPEEADLTSTSSWDNVTRNYLDSDPDCNVVIWSWCALSANDSAIDTYLSRMTQLESEYGEGGSEARAKTTPVTFVYMTGHSDGTGESGAVHMENQRIREYCEKNDKVLFDFYDFDCYDPSGNYFGDKYVNDDCSYRTGNWAEEWRSTHTEKVDWYDCDAVNGHTDPLNCNQKAYGTWWLLARIAGWDGVSS